MTGPMWVIVHAEKETRLTGAGRSPEWPSLSEQKRFSRLLHDLVGFRQLSLDARGRLIKGLHRPLSKARPGEHRETPVKRQHQADGLHPAEVLALLRRGRRVAIRPGVSREGGGLLGRLQDSHQGEVSDTARFVLGNDLGGVWKVALGIAEDTRRIKYLIRHIIDFPHEVRGRRATPTEPPTHSRRICCGRSCGPTP